MFFLQIAQAPVVVQLGPDRILEVPKYTLEEIVAWGAQIMTERTDKMTEGMSDARKAEILNFYPPVPPDLNEMRRYIQTPDGIKHIILSQLPRAKVRRKADQGELPALSTQDVTDLLQKNGTGPFIGLAWALADLVDTSTVDTTPKPPTNKMGDEDPSKQQGKRD